MTVNLKTEQGLVKDELFPWVQTVVLRGPGQCLLHACTDAMRFMLAGQTLGRVSLSHEMKQTIIKSSFLVLVSHMDHIGQCCQLLGLKGNVHKLNVECKLGRNTKSITMKSHHVIFQSLSSLRQPAVSPSLHFEGLWQVVSKGC